MSSKAGRRLTMGTRTKEIPTDEWKSVLDRFSKAHQGWLVTLEVIGAAIGDQKEADGQPLIGIGADVKDGERRVNVSLGGRRDAPMTKVIEEPQRIWLSETELPSHDAIAVEARDGTTTIVHFRHVDPEAGDLQIPGKSRGATH
jgi:hypothetical protein